MEQRLQLHAFLLPSLNLEVPGVSRQEQNLTNQKITMQPVRHPPPARRKKGINYDATLERVIRSYHTFDDGLEFLEAMAAVV